MGVTIERLTPGDGVHFPQKEDIVIIHYVGTLDNGSKFDSSRDRGKPFQTQIGVGRVIKGWDEGNVHIGGKLLPGVPQLSLNEKAILKITPDYGYGARGHPPVIPQNANLTFEVELIEIIKPKKN